MLILTRRIGEVTTLSGGIKVCVLHIGRSQVRLGWIAPADIKIHREEQGRSRDSYVRRAQDGL